MEKVADDPVVMQRQVSTVQRVQRTVEVPTVQFIDKLVDDPTVMQRQASTTQRCTAPGRPSVHVGHR